MRKSFSIFFCISKSTIFAGSLSTSKLNHILNITGFSKWSMPLKYLGAPIFKGRVRETHLQYIIDIMIFKLIAWKASLLFIAGRTLLVQSIIHVMITHSISIYSWLISLFKCMDKATRNFIWNWVVNKRKMVIVSWKKVCKHKANGWLGIRSLICINEASNIKDGWYLLNYEEGWAYIIRGRVVRPCGMIKHNIFSSIWHGVKS